MFRYTTHSPAQTKKLAAIFARELIKIKSGKYARVVALSGDLGSGKTTFAQGFLRALGVKKRITSPTFVITKRYALNAKRYRAVIHIDCYRIHRVRELAGTGIREAIADPNNIVLIEWPERIKEILPKQTIVINFAHLEKSKRTIDFKTSKRYI